MKWLTTIVLVGVIVTWLVWPTTAASPSTQIIIEDGAPYFDPISATVASGNPIRWDNPTPTHHTVTHDGCVDDRSSCSFDSGTIPPGEQFTIASLPPGRYVYHCRIHPILRGVLTVIDASQ